MKLDKVWFTTEQPRPGEEGTTRTMLSRITADRKSATNGVDDLEATTRALPVDGGKHLLVPVVVITYKGKSIECPWHTVSRYVVAS